MILFTFNKQIASIFTNEEEVLKNATSYLRVIAYTEIFLAMELVMEGVFSGKGNTLPSIIIGLPLNVLRIPIAYYLSNIYNSSYGVWLSIGLTTTLKGALLTIWFLIENRKYSYK
jgi:Na+-driven multidrug efflux pump